MYAIKIKEINKTYKLYSKPVDRLKEFVLKKRLHKEIIALKDISLNIRAGEIVGIVGDNGAGKSTLLKILAGTLKQTSGEIEINGRVAALLELGAGFHPEFTGLQNIYLNGSLLGLSREEIEKKEKEIIDFSELGDFINQPVKTYSSGMYVRLAFSIATSVDPDILIIDEALSVGDQHFQKKCIDKMMDFCKSNKTVVFCSHSYYHLQELCKRGIWIDNGSVKFDGNIKDTIQVYQNHVANKANKNNQENVNEKEKLIFIKKIWFEKSNGKTEDKFFPDEEILLKMEIGNLTNLSAKGHVGLGIIRYDDILAFGSTTLLDNYKEFPLENGTVKTMRIKSLPLLPGRYMVYGILVDESGLHPYDIQKSEPFKIVSNSKAYGMIQMEYCWED